jgi:starch synthase
VREPRNVWHVTREYAGIAEAGGVKDVVSGLAGAQARAGGNPCVVLPRYGFMPPTYARGHPVASFSLSLPDQDRGNAFFEEIVKVFVGEKNGVRFLFVDSPRFAEKRGVYVHTAEDEADNHYRKRGTGHWDSLQMNLILQRSALEAALALGEVPDVFHCHDGHTAFLPALLRADERFSGRLAASGSVVTIHNAGAGYHQEVWDQGFARLLTGLPDSVLEKGLLNGTVDPLLLAGFFAQLVTVSPWYAEEVLSERDREMSDGLGRALREQGIPLAGITNGIDPGPWDPRHPETTGLPSGFDPRTADLEGKKKCRRALKDRLGMTERVGAVPAPLYAFVGRLTGQKGIDVLLQALPGLLDRTAGCEFVILGQGERDQEDRLNALASDPATRGALAFIPRYDPSLAIHIFAASDFFLIPSAYEPCGLTDFIAQILGSIPVVHKVGGLNKVRDGETGFTYVQQSGAALGEAIERTARLFGDHSPLLEKIRRTGFEEVFSHHSWDSVLAEGYFPLYRRAMTEKSWTPR